MSRESVQSERAPAAVGPYSQACRARGSRTLYLSGQVPLVPATGMLLEGTAAEQAALSLDNLKAVLEAAGLGFEDVVRCTIYLTDMADFAAVNEVYARCFQAPFPARATVQVAALPKGARVEIDAIAERG
jgi:2-iminobutanoate/2-iminopropanoate deaminase